MSATPSKVCAYPNKYQHASRAEATLAAEKLFNLHGRVLPVYACGEHFHLTHQFEPYATKSQLTRRRWKW